LNQQKIGCFLKEIRKEKGLTQEQFSEIINVSTRTVSRWETGSNMPDLDILMKKLHVFAWIGVVSFIIFLVLQGLGFAEKGITENIANFCAGISFGMLVIAVIYTSNAMHKIKSIKKRLYLGR